MSPFGPDLGYTPFLPAQRSTQRSSHRLNLSRCRRQDVRARTRLYSCTILQAQHDALAADSNINVRRIPPI